MVLTMRCCLEHSLSPRIGLWKTGKLICGIRELQYFGVLDRGTFLAKVGHCLRLMEELKASWSAESPPQGYYYVSKMNAW